MSNNTDPNLQYLSISTVNVEDGRSLIPSKDAFYAEAVKRTITDPISGERRVVDTFKPVVRENANKLVRHIPKTSIEAKLELYEGTRIIIQPSTLLKNTERYIVGDLVLIKDRVYTLEYCDKPITELLTGIPDVAPLPISMATLYRDGTSVYPKFKYKTQRQLIDHIKNREALFNPLVSLVIEQPSEVLVRNTERSKESLKQALKDREEQFIREQKKLQEELEKLQ